MRIEVCFSSSFYRITNIKASNSNANFTDPPARVLKQTKCEATPDADIFSEKDLVTISEEGSVLSTRKLQPSALPKFVSLSKVLIAACALCLFYSDRICANPSTSRLLDGNSISIMYADRNNPNSGADSLQKYKKSSVDGNNDVASLTTDKDVVTIFCSLNFLFFLEKNFHLSSVRRCLPNFQKHKKSFVDDFQKISALAMLEVFYNVSMLSNLTADNGSVESVVSHQLLVINCLLSTCLLYTSPSPRDS